MSDLDNFCSDNKKDELIQHHEALRQSKEYQDQIKYLKRITRDFVQTTQSCWLVAARSTIILDNSLVFRSIDDLNQSIVAISTLLQEGMLTPARRELRYVLESSIKNLYVDQKNNSAKFDEKVKFLHEQVPRSSISVIDELALLFNNDDKVAFMADVKNMYASACAYVHPSRKQVEERINLASIEAYIGFERPQDLERINHDIFRLYEAVLIITFSALGPSLLGDLFIYSLDGYKEWKFHKGRYMKIVSAIFDYKTERKKHIIQLEQ